MKIQRYPAWIMTLALLISILSLRPVQAASPGGFCAGTEGWQIDLDDSDPPDPQCGEGTYQVDIKGDLSDMLATFDAAKDYIRNTDENFGTVWFQPAPVEPEPVEKVEVFAPTGFCEGNTGWPIDLNTQIPQDPQCGPGEYIVDVGGIKPVLETFELAVYNLSARGYQGTFWYDPPLDLVERVDVTAPEGFCEGTTGWAIDLVRMNPIDPNCGSGIYKVDIGGLLEDEFSSLQSAVDRVAQTEDKQGALWFIPEIETEPIQKVDMPAPEGFCKGTEGWGLDLELHIPIYPDCPRGTYKVEVGGDFGDFETEVLVEALNNLESRGGEGAIWFFPEPWFLYFPSVLQEKVLESSPEIFCEGTVGWFLNLFQIHPVFPDCDRGSYLIEANGEQETADTFREALDNLKARGSQGTIWFVPAPPEPIEVHAPARFCKGEEGWALNLALQIPVDPNCGDDDVQVNIGDQKPVKFETFTAAVEHLRQNGGQGTLWYLD